MSTTATPEERRAVLPGDDLVAHADAVMDRAFTIDAAPDRVWPWVQQLGKQRAGWYLPRRLERWLPRGRRAVRHVEDRWQHLRPGDVVPDYGGRHETFTVHAVHPPTTLDYTSQRGGAQVSWAITLAPVPTGPTDDGPERTRLHLRLRVGPLKHPWLVRTGGDAVDRLTIEGMAAGLAERLAGPADG
ncbi:SRPBCC family protein [Phycicoccus sonneratiae]|uniref:SRPBCC family protein n=1 Tax=Phycicoccus sonneratiae TaxID=2807628 RepID=A0ABS2CHI0_9MICO|nr:SRPBCC family protein [Phycicoccus sonneraticus]MBM6399323.1 SRPBCC family protein [Phycicoccus sonneraticus]